MYVSVPKNYRGMAFSNESNIKAPPTMPVTPPPQKREEACEKERKCERCENCVTKEKNPLTCLFEAFRGRERGGFDTEDFLLIGLIALLVNKEGNEDIVLILAMLLLM